MGFPQPLSLFFDSVEQPCGRGHARGDILVYISGMVLPVRQCSIWVRWPQVGFFENLCQIVCGQCRYCELVKTHVKRRCTVELQSIRFFVHEAVHLQIPVILPVRPCPLRIEGIRCPLQQPISSRVRCTALPLTR